MESHFDVFISYRRDGGSVYAQLIYIALAARGYSVFMDVRDLKSAPFDDSLRVVLHGITDFIVILTPSSLDRCKQPDDWVRQEIGCALAKSCTITPVFVDGFTFAGIELPEDIAGLSKCNGLKYSHEYCDAVVEQLVRRLSAKPRVELASVAKSLIPHVVWASFYASMIRRRDSDEFWAERKKIESLAADQILDGWVKEISTRSNLRSNELLLLTPDDIDRLYNRLTNLLFEGESKWLPQWNYQRQYNLDKILKYAQPLLQVNAKSLAEGIFQIVLHEQKQLLTSSL